MIPAWQTGIVRQTDQVTHNTRRFVIQVPELEIFHFLPGQFVTLDLPISEKRNKRWRSYSIASAPDDKNEFELIVVHVPGGIGTDYLFDQLKPGDKITLRGPAGSFVLPEKLDKDIFLICTGTGIAPFRSMVQHVHRNAIPHQRINLVFGTRTKEDLLYEDELKELEGHLDGFNYLPVLSREQWHGRTGYVHGVYEELCAASPEATFMLCGWKNMIDEAKNRILQLGYAKNDIIAELYG